MLIKLPLFRIIVSVEFFFSRKGRKGYRKGRKYKFVVVRHKKRSARSESPRPLRSAFFPRIGTQI